jgi:hypothetical protein
MTVGQEIHADYGTTGLSLKGHPGQLIRTELTRRKVIPAAEVWNRPHGRWVSVAGVVIIRQRPGTAKAIVFETLEDETGIVNLIIRPTFTTVAGMPREMLPCFKPMVMSNARARCSTSWQCDCMTLQSWFPTAPCAPVIFISV